MGQTGTKRNGRTVGGCMMTEPKRQEVAYFECPMDRASLTNAIAAGIGQGFTVVGFSQVVRPPKVIGGEIESAWVIVFLRDAPVAAPQGQNGAAPRILTG